MSHASRSMSEQHANTMRAKKHVQNFTKKKASTDSQTALVENKTKADR